MTLPLLFTPNLDANLRARCSPENLKPKYVVAPASWTTPPAVADAKLMFAEVATRAG